MKYVLASLLIYFSSQTCVTAEEIDSVLVLKAESKMYLLSKGERVKEYEVAFGGSPIGHKQQEGDEKKPEGRYVLDYKKADSAFYRSIHISYPNKADKVRAKENGVEPGGYIMIHGQKNGLGWLSFLTQSYNWTNGCIAVTNSKMDEIWHLIKAGTPIEIKP